MITARSFIVLFVLSFAPKRVGFLGSARAFGKCISPELWRQTARIGKAAPTSGLQTARIAGTIEGERGYWDLLQ
jgi:hypothetical protein